MTSLPSTLTTERSLSVFRRIAILIAVAILAAGAYLAYSFFRTPEEASAPIEALPVAVDQSAAESSAPAVNSTPTAMPAGEARQENDPAGAGPIIFEIVQEESEARFLIDEVLRGSDNTVVGSTDQVAGQIAVYPEAPSRSQVGVIQVNARTLATDNNFRNRALKNRILRTNEFEFITFTPTEIRNLPDVVAIGEPISFEIVGDLTVTDVTRPVVFEVTLTPVSRTRLEGMARATVKHADFNLAIPDSPQVDTVADDVILELSFVAVPAG
ncbi:MAG: YceI family protein [Caldilineae bacterium]|nr:MAG: YceI family protein [Caldilineae bacterium]